MAKYQIKESVYVRIDGAEEYFKADPQDPQIIDVPDDTEPGSRWIPLDDAAKSAKKKLLEYRALPKEKKEEEVAKRAAEREEAEVKEAQARFSGSQRTGRGAGGGGGGTEHHGGTELANPVPAGAHERGREDVAGKKGNRPSDKPVI